MSCHGNRGKKQKHSLKIIDCEKNLLFIRQYSEQYGLILSGRAPGFKSADLVVLPSSLTQKQLYRQYLTTWNAAGLLSVRYRSFRRVWKQALPNTVIQKPQSDLCSTCHKNLTWMPVLPGMTDEVKLAQLSSAQRDYYAFSTCKERTTCLHIINNECSKSY